MQNHPTCSALRSSSLGSQQGTCELKGWGAVCNDFRIQHQWKSCAELYPARESCVFLSISDVSNLIKRHNLELIIPWLFAGEMPGFRRPKSKFYCRKEFLRWGHPEKLWANVWSPTFLLSISLCLPNQHFWVDRKPNSHFNQANKKLFFSRFCDVSII